MAKTIIPNHSLKAGDILYARWGYDQTNIDFYKVAQICGKKKVLIVKVASKIVENNTYEDKVVPDTNVVGDLMPRMVNQFDFLEKEDYVRINYVATATKWNGKPLSQTAFGWGH
tara:strand:- start:515 stop:856 length:342 start_codon:yes stop_codon:yes gene_type:complete